MATPERQMSKSQQLAQRRIENASTGKFLGTFQLIERPARGSVEMGEVHKAIMGTLESKKAVRIPLDKGQDVDKLFRRVLRAPLRAAGALDGKTLRRVVSVDSMSVWVEQRKAKGESKPKAVKK